MRAKAVSRPLSCVWGRPPGAGERAQSQNDKADRVMGAPVGFVIWCLWQGPLPGCGPWPSQSPEGAGLGALAARLPCGVIAWIGPFSRLPRAPPPETPTCTTFASRYKGCACARYSPGPCACGFGLRLACLPLSGRRCVVQIGTATELTEDGGKTGKPASTPHGGLTFRLKNLRIRSAEK